jgi:hypothetical protein
MAGLIYLSERTRETFKFIDLLYGDLKKDHLARMEARIIGARGYHLLLFLSIMSPFIIMSWGQLPYHQYELNNKWALGLDFFNYSLSFLIIVLLIELLWLIINIVWSINEIGKVSNAFSTAIDVFSIVMKLRPLRNFFLIFIIYYFIAIALIISTYLSPTGNLSHNGEITPESIYFVVLLLIGGALFIAGLETIQRIINCRVENELDILNKRRDEQHQLLIKAILNGNSNQKADEIESISKVLDIIQKERDSLLQINRRAYDVASVSLFISSFLIPLLTLFEKLGVIHT